MGTPWCAGLPVVGPAMSDTPKPLTLILPYYENPRFLRQQLSWWWTYPAHLLEQLAIIVVDDGSPTTPAAAVLADAAIPQRLRLFRIDVDVRWNWLAARNIGAHHADLGWLLLTDMDHVLPASTLDALVYGQHDPAVIYGFSRVEHTGEVLQPHPNSWFIRQDLFWRVGGYDETLSGHYGTDGDWRRRCAAAAPMQILADRLIRHEFVADASTTHYLRKQPQDAAVKRLVARRKANFRPKVLSFPYHEERLGAGAGVTAEVTA